jgi:hypothetical protein
MLCLSPKKVLWNVNKFSPILFSLMEEIIICLKWRSLISPNLCIFIVWNFCHFAHSFYLILLEHEHVHGPVLGENFYECQACYSEKSSHLCSHFFPCSMLHVYLCYSYLAFVLALYTIFTLYRFIFKFGHVRFFKYRKVDVGNNFKFLFFLNCNYYVFPKEFGESDIYLLYNGKRVPDSTTLTDGIVHAVPRLVGGKGGKNLSKHIFFQIVPIICV